MNLINNDGLAGQREEPHEAVANSQNGQQRLIDSADSVWRQKTALGAAEPVFRLCAHLLVARVGNRCGIRFVLPRLRMKQTKLDIPLSCRFAQIAAHTFEKAVCRRHRGKGEVNSRAACPRWLRQGKRRLCLSLSRRGLNDRQLKAALPDALGEALQFIGLASGRDELFEGERQGLRRHRPSRLPEEAFCP